MHDVQLEDRLRAVLRREADALPFSLTADVIERRLAERRRAQVIRRSWLGIAAVVAVSVAVGGALLLNGRNAMVPAGASPTPTTTTGGTPPAVSPPGSIQLDVPDGEIWIDASAPANGTGPAITISDQSVRQTATVRVAFGCVGGGRMTYRLGGDETDTELATNQADCDGRSHVDQVPEARIPGRLQIEVVSSGAWHVIVTVERDPDAPTPGPMDLLPSAFELGNVMAVARPGFVIAATGEWDGSQDESTYPAGTRSRATYGTVPVATDYAIGIACRGIGDLEVSIGEPGIPGRHLGGWTGPCDGEIQGQGFRVGTSTTDVPLTVIATADPHAAYRIVILVPATAIAPEATAHTPTATCRDGTATPPILTLGVGRGTPVPGDGGMLSWRNSYTDVAGDTIPERTIEARVDDRLEIRIGGDVCATTWWIAYGLDATVPGEPGRVEPVWFAVPPQENPARDPDFASENRWTTVARRGDWIIKAVIGIPDGEGSVGDGLFYWHVVVN